VPTPSRTAARRVALARLISYAGTSAAYTALLYVVYQRTGSSTWVAGTLFLTLGTRGAITPLAGSLGDRLDRRRVMIVSDLLGAMCFLGLAFARGPALLVALAFLATLMESPFFPASAAAIPNLVGPADLAWANGTVAFGSSLGYVAGPAIGGLLVAAGGAGIVFALNAASFVASAALVATVRGSFAGRRTDVEEELHRGTRAGFVFLWNDPVLRRVTSAAAVFAVSVGSILVAELPLATAFGAGALGYGLLGTSFDFGAIFGALVAKQVTESRQAPWLVGGSFVTAAGLAAVAVMPTFPPVLAAMCVSGGSDGLVDVVVDVIFQRRSPDAVRSRVLAALEAVFLLGLAVAFPFGGLLVGALGPKAAYALGGAGCMASALMMVPLLRTRPPAPTSPEVDPSSNPGLPFIGDAGP
jgi:MFS family permease